tara:strand:- start:215 stop:346 length:132 start_codon:yes stop_codon:yes gene_type:complete
MAVKKECVTCALKTQNGCEIENKNGLKVGGCGAWIFRKEREDG